MSNAKFNEKKNGPEKENQVARKKSKKFYEITKEKPITWWEIILTIGAMGAAIGFFLSLTIGIGVAGYPLDSLLFNSILSCVLGFGVGLLLGYIIVHYLETLLVEAGILKLDKVEEAKTSPESGATSEVQAASAEVDKGKSVDYVLPEFSPEN
jgi:hypothetical protein